MLDFQNIFNILGCRNKEALEALLDTYDIIEKIAFNTYSNINKDLFWAHFLGQTSVESANFNIIEESLYYSAKRMCQVWPGRFKNIEEAEPYAGKPAKLANFVYGGRMGNNKKDDGYKYRGRGWIQLTGKDNYKKAAKFLGLNLKFNLISQPDLAMDPKIAWIIAGWYISQYKILIEIHNNNINNVTRLINGGHHGIKQRIKNTNTILNLINGPKNKPILKIGSIGPYVIKVQKALQEKGYLLEADSIFGKTTENSIKSLQRNFNLKQDGIVGINTYKILGIK